MSVVLKFANEEQYRQFISKVKEDVLKEIEEKHHEEKHQLQNGLRRNSYLVIKDELSEEISLRARGEKKNEIPSREAFYEFFKCCFLNKRSHISELSSIPIEDLRKLKDMLIAIVDGYRKEITK